ncbi:hypothetical protein E2C01_060055 [Portunus trituberculatus]|uniref:Uncharacterized protein n=1 Tax=Portunus trituberculatus TaxID=210409 RepID=A0A5B7H9F3_PORTR|nr:hypothetical protein [Portunus trituberculatus]
MSGVGSAEPGKSGDCVKGAVPEVPTGADAQGLGGALKLHPSIAYQSPCSEVPHVNNSLTS